MGRRALRKTDPNLNLSRHLVAVEDLPEHWTSRALFENDRPLEIEVGSGKGLFLSSATRSHPLTNFVGIEVSRKYARFAAAKLAKAETPNGMIVHGDALLCFRTHIRDESVTAVHVYFPDPWWKKRHRRRRVMSESFLSDVQRSLLRGGRLHFWTDVQEYFDTSLELIAQSTSLLGPLAVLEKPAEHEMDYRTHFERRVRMHDQRVFRAEFERRDD